MALDYRDPHYALGIEHGSAGEMPYPFQDAENLRRYLLGYESGAAQRRLDGMASAMQQPGSALRIQQQQPQRITASDLQAWWMNRQKP